MTAPRASTRSEQVFAGLDGTVLLRGLAEQPVGSLDEGVDLVGQPVRRHGGGPASEEGRDP